MASPTSAWQTLKDNPIYAVCGAFSTGCAVTFAATQAFLVTPMKERLDQRAKDSTAVERRFPVLAREKDSLRVRADSLTQWNVQRAAIIARQDTNLVRWQTYAQQLANRLGVTSQDASLLNEIRRLEAQKASVENEIETRSKAGVYGNSDQISPANQALIQQLSRQATNLQDRILLLQGKLLP